MLETIVLLSFLASVVLCLIVKIDVLFALGFGLVLFSAYSLYRGNGVKKTLLMLWTGVKRVKNVILLLLLVAGMTAVWRAGGTIAYILYHAIGFIRPRVFVLCAFLLCAGMSFLIGSAFGTASTVGFILMMLSNAAGLPPALTGSAILAGAYVGDRGSPMSGSAQLVSALTETDIYHNVRGMIKTGAVPFAVTCVLYVVLAKEGAGHTEQAVTEMFAESFSLHWTTIVPAVLMIALALARVNVKIAVFASIVAGVAVSVFVQGMPFLEVLWCMVTGYEPQGDALVRTLLGGGGIRSMLRIIAIPTLSSSYSGIFAATGLLDGVTALAERIAKRVTAFTATLLVATFANCACCNQTLATIMTEQICHRLDPDKERFAMTLENTVIVIAPIVPWSIAGSASLLIVGAPIVPSMLLCFYLYLIPLWNWMLDFLAHRKAKAAAGPGLPKDTGSGYNSGI